MRAPAIPLTLLVIAAAGCTDSLPTSPLADGSSAAVVAAANDVQLPFRGTLSTTHTADLDLETLIEIVHLVGDGTATHLGRYTWVSEIVLDLRTLAGTETATLTAANGDILSAEGTAVGTPSDDGQSISSVETLTITGGTGRFADATGSFVLRQAGIAADRASSGSFEGSIRLRP